MDFEPEQYENMDDGVVEWIRKAIKWNELKLRNKSYYSYHQLELDGCMYEIQYNSLNDELVIANYERVIITQRRHLVTDFPEIQFVQNGLLLTEITEYITRTYPNGIIEKMQAVNVEVPATFIPYRVDIDGNWYEMSFRAKDDMLYVRLPKREIFTNLLEMEKDAPELAETHDSEIYGRIRELVVSNR